MSYVEETSEPTHIRILAQQYCSGRLAGWYLLNSIARCRWGLYLLLDPHGGSDKIHDRTGTCEMDFEAGAGSFRFRKKNALTQRPRR